VNNLLFTMIFQPFGAAPKGAAPVDQLMVVAVRRMR
jgi:hypothetical protein